MNWLVKIIQKERLKREYNFQDIERITGIPAKKMYQFEKGHAQLSIEELESLLEFLGIDRSALLPPKKRLLNWKRILFPLAILFLLALTLYFLIPYIEELSNKNSQPAPENLGMEKANFEGQVSDTQPVVHNNETPDVSASVSPIGEAAAKDSSAVLLRFWGNLPYQTAEFPALPDQTEDKRVIEILPIEQLKASEELPIWLTQFEKNDLILNLGTREIWSEGTIRERDRLNKLGYKNVGLDYQSEVYKPLVVDIGDMRVGFLPFTRIIHKANEIAGPNHIGLAKVYDQKLLLQTVRNAKQNVDLLIVLMGWGKRWGEKPEQEQKLLAAKITEAGADLIVGNHSIFGQEAEWVNEKPVFYSLGHTISPGLNQSSFSYILEAEIKEKKIEKLKIRIGTLKKGVISFDLNETEKKAVEKDLLPLFPVDPKITIIY